MLTVSCDRKKIRFTKPFTYGGRVGADGNSLHVYIQG